MFSIIVLVKCSSYIVVSSVFLDGLDFFAKPFGNYSNEKRVLLFKKKKKERKKGTD